MSEARSDYLIQPDKEGAVPYVSVLSKSTTRSLPPYQTQIGQGVLNACGPACALMLARWVGRGMTDTVAQWANRIDAPHDGTTTQDLAGMFKLLGLTPLTGMAVPLPRIELVRYSRLPNQNSAYKGQAFLHWIVRLSPTEYHDPLWNGDAGARLTGTSAQLDAAMIDPASSVGISERPQENTTMTQTATCNKISWNVRAAPSTSAAIIGVLARGDAINIAGTVRGENATWYVIEAKAGGAQIKQSSDEKTHVTFFVRSDGFATAAPPAPAIAKTLRLGLHVLNPAAGNGGRIAEQAYALGCRVFTVIDDEQFAVKLARMGCRVFFRWWIGNNHISPGDLAGRVRAFCGEPGIVILGLNEGDVTGCFTAENMDARGAWDAEAFRLIRAQGGTYAGFGCAMGNPEYNDPRVCEVVKKWYAPLWEAGMRINYHSYSHDYSKLFSAYDWYEGRWRFLFTRCGLNPANPAGSEIIGDETGVDVMGHGGFASYGAGDADIQNWCRLHYDWQSRPLIVNGVSFASPFTDATLFQSSDSSQWAGYNVRPQAALWSRQ